MRTFLLVLFGLALVSSCAGESDEDDGDSRCEAYCKRSNCPSDPGDDGGEDPGADARQCSAACTAVGQVNRDSGCGDEFDALLTCSEGLADACDPNQEEQCAEVGATWADCIIAYCEAHPEDTHCT